jgi:prepilin-type N-terminal cleavage/methylation domain-containing protein
VAWRLLKDQAREASMVARANSREGGFTLIEIAIVITIIAIMSALAIPAMEQWVSNARLKEAARQVADAFALARERSIRTGDYTIVFFQKDMLGAALLSGGNPVPILTLDDGRPNTPGHTCRITPAKAQTAVNAQTGVNWGDTFAGAVRAPNDTGTAANFSVSGSSFTDQTGAPATWVMFDPNGIPLGVTPACVAGITGSGGGTIYITNGNRDYAVSLSPLGGVYVTTWNAKAAPPAWRP